MCYFRFHARKTKWSKRTDDLVEKSYEINVIISPCTPVVKVSSILYTLLYLIAFIYAHLHVCKYLSNTGSRLIEFFCFWFLHTPLKTTFTTGQRLPRADYCCYVLYLILRHVKKINKNNKNFFIIIFLLNFFSFISLLLLLSLQRRKHAVEIRTCYYYYCISRCILLFIYI
jgi:hypothetical protein